MLYMHLTIKVPFSLLAGGISHASAFVLVAEP